MDLGRVGVWQYQLDQLPSSQSGELAAELEELGYGAIWIPEMIGRESFVNSTLLLSATDHIVVATGIAGIYSRDPLSANSALNTITEAFPERFLMGLGVSHQVMVEGIRGHDYTKPYSKMVAYLDGMDAGMFTASPPTTPTHRALAALGPKMLKLAAERTDGAHPYFIPVEHTAFAREQMGPDAGLYPEQAVVLESDRTRAREIARAHMSTYLTLPNYTNNLKRFGMDRRRPGPRWLRCAGRRHRGVGRRVRHRRARRRPPRRRGRPRLHPGPARRADQGPARRVAAPGPGPAGLIPSPVPGGNGRRPA